MGSKTCIKCSNEWCRYRGTNNPKCTAYQESSRIINTNSTTPLTAEQIRRVYGSL